MPSDERMDIALRSLSGAIENYHSAVFTIAEESPVEAVGGLSVNADYSLDDRPKPHVLVVPGGQAGSPWFK